MLTLFLKHSKFDVLILSVFTNWWHNKLMMIGSQQSIQITSKCNFLLNFEEPM